MSAHLEAVREAAERRAESEADFRSTLRAARGEGATWAELAEASGLSRTGVRYLALELNDERGART